MKNDSEEEDDSNKASENNSSENTENSVVVVSDPESAISARWVGLSDDDENDSFHTSWSPEEGKDLDRGSVKDDKEKGCLESNKREEEEDGEGERRWVWNGRGKTVGMMGAAMAVLMWYEVHTQEKLTSPPIVFYQETPWNRALCGKMGLILLKEIRPSIVVGTRSISNSMAAYMHLGPRAKDEHVAFRETFVMPADGATIAVDWELPANIRREDVSCPNQQRPVFSSPLQNPIVLILHGINNDASFGYIRNVARKCSHSGYIAAAMNLRGCGGVPVTTPRGYTAAYTGDIRRGCM